MNLTFNMSGSCVGGNGPDLSRYSESGPRGPAMGRRNPLSLLLAQADRANRHSCTRAAYRDGGGAP